ncbi:MAG TPA: hypothetical protein DCQ83_06480 [Fibrobacteres bacterium]|nr:hypothetical protein [Fibrobacterota bacterium]
MLRISQWKGLWVALTAIPCLADPLLIPSNVLTATFTTQQHPYAASMNSFLQSQGAYTGNFTPTGLSRADYLPLINSITRALQKMQASNGAIIDPVLNREDKFSSPAYAHCVSVLFKSGYAPLTDTAFLNSGMRAMTLSISEMTGNTVPDSHGDFFTVLLMQAYQNFNGIVPTATLSTWRTNLGRIAPGTVYHNSAQNWIAFNMSGEFMRYQEGLTTIDWVQTRMTSQVKSMGTDGLYQDTTAIDTTNKNLNGFSFAYDNVARMVLGVIARGGYAGTYSAELNRALWKGGWSGLLYQSPAGEVPTGMRSSHHLWNEGYAAANYEMWANQYKMAGYPNIAGAFKRAAMLSLAANKLWLQPDGAGYVTKARYAPSQKWGYMAYSGFADYNALAASVLGSAWQMSDSTILEQPAPADIGGYVLPVLSGFKKIFASAGGTYAEFDIRGDQSHNPTGLIRVHLKTSLPQLGPSDGAMAGHIASAQYWPLYPTADAAGLPNTGVGPGWLVSGTWKTLGAMQQLPTVTILEQTQARASFRVSYTIDSSSKLNEMVIVEPGGVTVIDSVIGGGINGLRIYYPMLLTDGEQTSTVSVNGNSVILGLRGKGSQFYMTNPSASLVRTNVTRNHRNGRCELIYADVGRTAEYHVTAWPVYTPVSVQRSSRTTPQRGPLIAYDGAFLQVEESGLHREEIRTLTGHLLWSNESRGRARYDLREVGHGAGVLMLMVKGEKGLSIRKMVR